MNPWDRHSREFLASYMVQEVENPTLNVQSVLMRGVVADTLWPGETCELTGDELLYAAAASHCLLAAREGWLERLAGIIHDRQLADPLLPAFMAELLTSDAPPFDLTLAVWHMGRCLHEGFSDLRSPFEHRWIDTARSRVRRSKRLRLLELGCGSAVEWRYLERHGLAEHIDYTGVDLSAKNVANARSIAQGGRFEVASAAALPFADQSFDLVVAFDLFEHLSEADLAVSLREAARVCDGELFLSLFNADWSPDHDFIPHADYHWNRLSLNRLVADLSDIGWNATVVDIPADWPQRHAGYRHYNPHARVILADRDGMHDAGHRAAELENGAVEAID